MVGRDALIDYFAFVERRGYEVTFNDFSGLLVTDPGESARLGAYLIHRNPFCLAVKSEARLWAECLRRKAGLCAAAAEAGDCFRGTCFAGREEYVQPVLKDGIVLGTLALGGFATDREDGLARARRAFGGDLPAAAEAAYGAALSVPPPAPEDARAILGLAKEEFLHLYAKLEAKTGSLVVPDAARITRERRLVLHAAEYLRRNSTRLVPAEEVAAACHVSVSTLSHVFKRTMGASLRSYALGLRLETAKEALQAGRSVTEAALEAGFDDPNYFSRAFSEAEGLSPREWRRGALSGSGPRGSPGRG